MDEDSLRRHLAVLHDELRAARPMDAGSRASLAEVLRDIQRILEERGAAPEPTPGAAPASSAAPLAQRLEQAAVRFEVDHPALASSSRRLIDLLGKVGL